MRERPASQTAGTAGDRPALMNKVTNLSLFRRRAGDEGGGKMKR